jgi:hypothetical protein
MIADMARKGRPQTFAELYNEPTWSESAAARRGRHAVRPGKFNAAGQFFDPFGGQLALLENELSVNAAQMLVEEGAMVAAEDCGCGGSYGNCAPQWLSDEQLRVLQGGPAPRFSDRGHAPAWIDVWSNDSHIVVFLHGNVLWGDVLT